MEYYTWMIAVCSTVFAMLSLKGVNLLHTGCDTIYDVRTRYYSANCSSRSLQHIPFDLHHNIKVLDLKHNSLRILQPNSFAKYDSLTELYLQNNSISMIKKDAFLQLKHLEILDLSINQLKSVPLSTFEGLTSLRILNLKGNRISILPNSAFSHLMNLRSLHLDGNYVEEIAIDAFRGLDYLENLELQHNNIKVFYQGVEKYFTHRFKSLRIYNNPWICDCKNRWFEDYLIRHQTNITGESYIQWMFPEGEPKCNGPNYLKGRLFSDLNTGDFVCQISMYSSGQDVVAEPGNQVKLYCKYLADPHEDPVWTKNKQIISEAQNPQKYSIKNEITSLVTSILTIEDFQKYDIGDYMCKVENARGPVAIKFPVSIDGVDPSAYTFSVLENNDESPQNSHTVTIAMSVIGGFVFLLLVMGIIIYSVTRCRRNQRKKSEQRSMMFKEHLKTNVLNHSEITDDKEMEKPETVVLTDVDEHDPLYDHVGNNHIHTNTYVSFKQEFVEPEEMNQLYTGSVNRTKGSDGSQCESTSPLLDNCSPIMCNSHDLLYETSNGSSIYTPALVPRANTLNSRYLPSLSSYDTYLSYTPYSTMSHCGPPRSTSTPPPMSMRKKSASATYIGPVVPPKKPPRIFNSGDSMSLSQTSSSGSDTMQLKLSLPKPGTVDEFGTAV